MSYSAIVFGMGIVALIFVFLSMNVSIPDYDESEMKKDKRKFWDALLSSALKILFNSGAMLMFILILNTISIMATHEGYNSFDLNVPIESAYFLSITVFIVYLSLKVVSLIYDTYNILASGVDAE
jgi:hypothetical protein